MKETNIKPNPPPTPAAGSEIRQWCVEKAIGWCKPGEDTTDDMLEAAEKLEKYVTSDARLPLMDIASLIAALEDAEIMTPGVSQRKARLVCRRIVSWLTLPNEQAHTPPPRKPITP